MEGNSALEDLSLKGRTYSAAPTVSRRDRASAFGYGYRIRSQPEAKHKTDISSEAVTWSVMLKRKAAASIKNALPASAKLPSGPRFKPVASNSDNGAALCGTAPFAGPAQLILEGTVAGGDVLLKIGSPSK